MNNTKQLHKFTSLRLSAGLLALLSLLPCQGAAESTPEASQDSAKASETNKATPEKLTTLSITANITDPFSTRFSRPASVLESDDLLTRNRSTLGETLDLEPGLRSSYFGQGASRPVIRGFSGDRVRILKNGVGTQDVSNLSEDHVVTADPLQATRIDIFRGPETLRFGSSAIGGAVNVTDDSIPEESAGQPISGQVLGQFGTSADNERTGAVKIRGESGNWQFVGSTFARDTASYDIPGFAESEILRESEEHGHEEHGDEEHGDEEHSDEEHGEEGHGEEGHHDEDEARGRVPGTQTEAAGGSIGASYLLDDGFVGVSVSGFNTEYGVPGHAHEHEDEEEHGHDDEGHGDEEEHGEDGVLIDAEQLRVDVRGRHTNVSDDIAQIEYRIGLSTYEHDEIEGDGVATTYERDAVEARVELAHTPIGNFEGLFGTQFIFDDFSAVGEESFVSPVKTFQPGIFGFEEYTLNENLTLQMGGRVEVVAYDSQQRSNQEFVPFSASAGPVWDVLGNEEYTLGVNVAYAERAPAVIELYANGAHVARQISERGDETLGKERSIGIDLALRKNSGVVTGSFTPFYQRFENFINLAATGETDGGFGVFAYEEVEAYFWGFEAESSLHLHEVAPMGRHAFSLDGQVDLVRARATNENESLPRIPPLRTIVRGRYSFDQSWNAMVEGVFINSQDRISPGELPTKGYTALNAEVSVAVPVGNGRTLDLFARGSNLTDAEARVHSSFLKDLAPLRGRAGLMGVRARF